MTTVPIAAPEYSNPYMTRVDDGTITVTWGVRGTKACTIVADELIDEMAADKNRVVALEAALRDLVVATGRLEASDGASDALFGVLDMRTRASALLEPRERICPHDVIPTERVGDTIVLCPGCTASACIHSIEAP